MNVTRLFRFQPILADPSHAAVLAAIHATAFPPAEHWNEAAIAAQLVLPGGFGLLDPAGAMVLGRMAADEAEILAIGVLPAYRRSGVGHRLLAQAAAGAHGAGAAAMFLEVAARNLPAQKLYQSHGFFPAGRRKAYYADGDDALLLRADLPLAKHGLGKDPKRA